MKEICLRKATLQDAEQLHIWRNDPDVRKWSFHTGEISLEEHMKWFLMSLERDDVEIFILEENGQAVGQIRLTYWYDELVIGYSIDRACRGRHLGQRLVELMEVTLQRDDELRKDGEYFVAYVQKDNIVSRRVFQVLGYAEEEQRKWIKYVKKMVGG
ncbi:MAG: GNAT family N-acetyltransferase [Eubacteriales bacterium]|nr:GNAT family N-acetyltransferase [Eubacteriales bacterium]